MGFQNVYELLHSYICTDLYVQIAEMEAQRLGCQAETEWGLMKWETFKTLLYHHALISPGPSKTIMSIKSPLRLLNGFCSICLAFETCASW